MIFRDKNADRQEPPQRLNQKSFAVHISKCGGRDVRDLMFSARRQRGIYGFIAVFLLGFPLLAGCQSYHPMPLTETRVNQALQVPVWKQLRISAQRIRGIGLPPLPLRPTGGITPNEAAVIAVILNPSLRATAADAGDSAGVIGNCAPRKSRPARGVAA